MVKQGPGGILVCDPIGGYLPRKILFGVLLNGVQLAVENFAELLLLFFVFKDLGLVSKSCGSKPWRSA